MRLDYKTMPILTGTICRLLRTKSLYSNSHGFSTIGTLRQNDVVFVVKIAYDNQDCQIGFYHVISRLGMGNLMFDEETIDDQFLQLIQE